MNIFGCWTSQRPAMLTVLHARCRPRWAQIVAPAHPGDRPMPPRPPFPARLHLGLGVSVATAALVALPVTADSTAAVSSRVTVVLVTA